MVRLNTTGVAKVSRYQPMEPFSPSAQDIMTETVITVGMCVCTSGLDLNGSSKVLILTVRGVMTKVEEAWRYQPMEPFSPSVQDIMKYPVQC